MSDNDISLGIDEGREARKKKKNENQKKISCHDFFIGILHYRFRKKRKEHKIYTLLFKQRLC